MTIAPAAQEELARKALQLLGADTVARLVAGYEEIAKQNGFGSIRLRFEAVGSSKEKHFVALETEQKTR